MAKFPTWLRYGFPAICACMGTWQLYRLQWKKNLIRQIEEGLHKPPIKLESIPADMEACRFRRLKLYGDPDLSGIPVFVGPKGATDIGYPYASSFIIPFRLFDGTRVLVDYGKVPLGREEEIRIPTDVNYLETVLDTTENRAWGMAENDPDEGRWSHKDISSIARHLRTEPLLFKRITRKPSRDSIPIPGMPRVQISNRHFEYILTWYGAAAATLALSFLKR